MFLNSYIWLSILGHGTQIRGKSNETQFTSMEKTKEDALEMAQETDATRKTDAEAKTVIILLWEHGVTRHHYGLQLGMITRGSSDV